MCVGKAPVCVRAGRPAARGVQGQKDLPVLLQLEASPGQKKSKQRGEGHKLESLVLGPGTHFAKTVLDEDIAAPTAAVRKD